MCCGSPAKGAGFGGKTKNVLIGGREILRGWKEDVERKAGEGRKGERGEERFGKKIKRKAGWFER